MTKPVDRKISAVGDKILVREIEEPNTTAGGIVLPDQTKLGGEKARVVSVGKGVRTISGEFSPLEVAEGDTVWYKKASSVEVDLEGEKYRMIREYDIIAVSR